MDFYSVDKNESEIILNKLLSLLVNSNKFEVVDRSSSLEIIKREQKFHYSGEVDEASARSIGKFVGAELVVIGNIKILGAIKQLNIKALNVETGRIVSMISENI